MVKDAVSGLPIQADIFLVVESDASNDIEIEVSTDGTGAFSFNSLYVSYWEEVVYRYLIVLPEFPYSPYYRGIFDGFRRGSDGAERDVRSC